ncbi:hypothetical protein [Cytobacillus solani]|uniref:Uncharacterized protein n=1 Tax=Cytobacillus solani TaxID=1637975 RepID=A0A0Q3SEL8_9BACI|nr:hypothetical protein [Cytobacillus solani]KOP78200.1 hypothetical protein AMS60_18720 [Bacillus sp. FJAT-21945]KQL17700.1 hypothetical protein AN957_03120 [Cytobacillus solani]
MKKKILSIAAAVGVSFSMLGPVSAAPVETITIASEDVSTQNIQKGVTQTKYYLKSEYSSSQVPKSITYSDSNGFYGSLTLQGSLETWGTYGEWWKATYSGIVTKAE